jgi:peroxiredoxin
VVLVVVLGFGAWFVTELLRQNGRLLRRLEAVEAMLGVSAPDTTAGAHAVSLPLGTPAPAFQVLTSTGAEASLGGLRARGRTIALVFTDPNCGPCRALLPEVADLQRRHVESLTLAVVISGTHEHAKAWTAEYAIDDLLVAPSGELARSYGVLATPSAVLIGADGRIASPVARGARGVHALVEHSVRDQTREASEAPIPPLRGAPMLSAEAGGPRAH